MFTLSAFADEISPHPEIQAAVLKDCGISHIELRSVNKINVLDLTDLQISELKSLFDRNGFKVSALGSPIGKVPIDQPFEPQLARFRRALELCRVFETTNMRIFSYYLAEGGDWDNWRRDVMDRMWDKLRLAERAGVRLLHENEHRIYGDDPERVKDLMETILEQVPEGSFAAIYDPANYVVCGYDPWQAWQMTKPWTAHFHIKDWVRGEPHARVAGEGNGRIADVMADAAAGNFTGFATLEPHLLAGGPTGGITGPEQFPRAVEAFRAILDRVGASWQ
jgi:sugar phosphate isomerase/epimerase